MSFAKTSQPTLKARDAKRHFLSKNHFRWEHIFQRRQKSVTRRTTSCADLFWVFEAVSKYGSKWSEESSVTRFGKGLQVFGEFLMVYFLFGIMLSLLWRICDIMGLIFIVANGQILKNNATIWSHWSEDPRSTVFLAKIWSTGSPQTRQNISRSFLSILGNFGQSYLPKSGLVGVHDKQRTLAFGWRQQQLK